MEALRFSTAGNVDDGKSTLIGRLLLDSGTLPEDRLPDPEKLHFVTDGLRFERSHGITLDVAYRYFSTAKRRFILADCPGHQELLPAFFSGVSQTDATVLLVDAVRGISPQTKMHLALLGFLAVPRICVAINKLDECEFAESVFLNLVQELKKMVPGISAFIPVSAKRGDNIVFSSVHTPWYSGPALLDWLENTELAQTRFNLRIAIQAPLQSMPSEVWHSGFVLQGNWKSAQALWASIPGKTPKRILIRKLNVEGKEARQAEEGQAVAFMAEDRDLPRGTFLHLEGEAPAQNSRARSRLFSFQRLEAGEDYRLLNAFQSIPIQFEESADALAILERDLKSSQAFLIDQGGPRSGTGRFLIVHSASQQTVAAGFFV